MLFLLILVGLLNPPFHGVAETCTLHNNELCCVWSYDICDIQPTKGELAEDPHLNKIFEQWCFSLSSLIWDKDPDGPYYMDDHEAFLLYATPEELEQAKKYWEEGD